MLQVGSLKYVLASGKHLNCFCVKSIANVTLTHFPHRSEIWSRRPRRPKRRWHVVNSRPFSRSGNTRSIAVFRPSLGSNPTRQVGNGTRARRSGRRRGRSLLQRKAKWTPSPRCCGRRWRVPTRRRLGPSPKYAISKTAWNSCWGRSLTCRRSTLASRRATSGLNLSSSDPSNFRCFLLFCANKYKKLNQTCLIICYVMKKSLH